MGNLEIHPINRLMQTLRQLPVLCVSAIIAALVTPIAPATAQTQEPDYSAMALRWAQNEVSNSQDGQGEPLRYEVTVGALDSRLRLAACSNVEPYLPYGARLWGHSHVGLRCMDGKVKWNVSVPVTVKAFGNAWVVRGQILAGSPLKQTDVMKVEVNWAEESSPVLLDSGLWLGQSAARALSTGQVLRQGMVRATQVFQAGTQIRVVVEGQGFQVSSDAQALTAGIVGEVVRVRMDSGRITTGTVLDARTVVIYL